MIWIGLTGGVASGKSTAARIIRELGYPVVDADVVARKVVEPQTSGWDQVKELIGNEFIGPDGQILRRELGQKVFSDRDLREKLERILHPLIQTEVEREKKLLEESGVQVAFYDVPLLFEKGLGSRFDRTLLIYAPLETQKLRAKAREGWSESEIEQRVLSQIPIEEKRGLADDVIDNSGDVDQLRARIKQQLERYKGLIK